jgi:hypothetical protein
VHWQQIDARPLVERQLAFTFDLDLLAPLGNGEGNFAAWFAERDSSSPEQPEVDELAEQAAAWADQARCSFYPDVYPFEGFATRLPDLGRLADIVGAWVAEARREPQRAEVLGRRAIRLGRLLLMDELSAAQHLAGLQCVAAEAELLYEHGRRTGDRALTRSRATGARRRGEAAPSARRPGGGRRRRAKAGEDP